MTMRPAIALVGCLGLSGCFGDRIFQSDISVSLPGQDLVATEAALSDVLQARHYRRHSEPLIDGKNIRVYCNLERPKDKSCASNFPNRARLVESKEDRDRQHVNRSFDVIKGGRTVMSLSVWINHNRDGTDVLIGYDYGLDKMTNEQREEYNGLRQALEERFGPQFVQFDR